MSIINAVLKMNLQLLAGSDRRLQVLLRWVGTWDVAVRSNRSFMKIVIVIYCEDHETRNKYFATNLSNKPIQKNELESLCQNPKENKTHPEKAENQSRQGQSDEL